MTRKILLYIGFTFIIILVFNYNSFKYQISDYIGVKEYNNGNYNKSSFYFNGLYNQTNNPLVGFNLSNSLYKNNNYKESINIIDFLLKKVDINDKIKAELLYNKGNNLYNIFKENNDTEILIQAIKTLKNALDFTDDIDTNENYEFLKSLLDNIQNENNQEDKNENKPDNSTEEKNQANKDDSANNTDESNTKKDDIEEGKTDKKEGETDIESDDNNNNQIAKQERGDEYILGGEKNDNLNLTEGELNQINEYIEQLSKEQVKNQKYFNKNNDSNNLTDSFFGNGDIFNNDLNTEKDW